MRQEIGQIQHRLKGRRGEMYDMYLVASVLHRRGYDTIQRMMAEAKKGELTQEEAVDIIHFMLRAHERLKKFLSIIDIDCKTLQSIVGTAWVQANLTNPEGAGYIQGEIAKGYPNVRATPILPKKSQDPEAYAKLMTYMGIPEALWKQDVVEIHWPGMIEYVTSLAENGLPTPPGINPGSTYPRFSVSTRAHKGKELDEPESL